MVRNQQRTSYMRLVEYVEDKIEQEPGQGGEGFYFAYADNVGHSEWVIPHSFNRVPQVTVFDEFGREMDADVYSTATAVTITHAEPMRGSAILIA